MKLKNLFILGPEEEVEVKGRWKEETEKLNCGILFPHLDWNDLLRFRRICKDAKELTDEYIKSEGERLKLCPEITIYERGTNKDKCLERFLELGFPATSVYIMNTSGAAMFEKEAKHFAKFSERSGPGSKIVQVRVHQLSPYPGGIERIFFEHLANLKSLHVDMFGGACFSDEEVFRKEQFFLMNLHLVSYPKRFKQLKKVTIGQQTNVSNKDILVASREVTGHCMELDYCADAFSSYSREEHGIPNKGVLGWAFDMIEKYIEKRSTKFGSQSNLKYYDFVGYHHCRFAQQRLIEFVNSDKFIKLVKTCEQHSVKLLNVNSAWLQKWKPKPLRPGAESCHCLVSSTLSRPVVSMVNLHGMVIPLTLPNLEKLTIPATSRSSLVPRFWLKDRQPWPALKILDVTVDSKKLYTPIVAIIEGTNKAVGLSGDDTITPLMQFLFVGIQRAAVTEVSLAFVEGVDVDDGTVEAATKLGVCCPNLKKLTLVNWPGTNATLIKILGDVKALEELCLDNCKKIGNLAFTKTDTTDGLIQQHPGLKKLSLKQLDKMPKVTDKLFQDVISRMKLTHLLLSSDKPLTNVTPDGITALKNGEFAKSIEKFPFSGWSLANVSNEKFTKMGKEFRSYNMI